MILHDQLSLGIHQYDFFSNQLQVFFTFGNLLMQSTEMATLTIQRWKTGELQSDEVVRELKFRPKYLYSEIIFWYLQSPDTALQPMKC